MKYSVTEDGRYFVVRGRLWRCSNPALTPEDRKRYTTELMTARRGLRGSKDDTSKRRALRARVQAAKEALGERGALWWNDGSPSYNRCMVKNTPYAEWYESICRDDAHSDG